LDEAELNVSISAKYFQQKTFADARTFTMSTGLQSRKWENECVSTLVR